MAFVPFLGFEASAGSGKTFNLVVRYLSLLFMGVKPEKILALTFTNKAASEMSERIITTLIELEKRGELEFIAQTLECSKEEILAARESVLKTLLSSELKIMTIDKFFAQVLRKFSLYEGLQPSFSISGESAEIEVIKQMLGRSEVAGEIDKLIGIALMSQKRVLDIFELFRALYIKVKEFDLPYYEESLYQIEEAKALAAAREIQQLVLGCKEASVNAVNGVDFNTIEELLDKSWIGRESLNYVTFKKCYTPAMDEALGRMQESLKAYFTMKEKSFFHRLFALLDLYAKSRLQVARRGGQLTFDDVTVILHHLLKERIERDFIYFRLDAKIDHIMLDEFQDTSVIQFDMLAPLIEELVSGQGASEIKSFFYVGDVKQSIYRFRGGNKALFKAVEERFGVTMQRLNTNFRSKAEVVHFVNRAFERHIEGYFPQEVAPGHEGGYVEVIEDEDLIAQSVDIVVKLIERGVAANDIAILTWQNRDGLLLEEALKAKGIEVVTETNSRLIHHPHVAALIELLKYYYFEAGIYFENFKALLGLEDVVPVPMDLKTLSLKHLLHRLIRHYTIFDGDQNIIKFLDVIVAYKDVDQLIFEIESEGESLTRLDQAGVRVLTVHKSKGLEFAHVISIDRLGRKNADRSLIMYHYDKVDLKRLFLRQKGREAFDRAYKSARDYNSKMVAEDELNAMYVAFTRAEESLYIIRKPKSSIFAPLELELGHYGTPGAVSRRPEVSKALPQFEYAPLALGLQEVELSSDRDESHDYAAIEYGLGLHYTLEMLADFTPKALDLAMTAMSNRYNLDEEKKASIARRVEALLHEAQFQQLVSGRVRKEQPLSIDGKLYYIDLLVEHDDFYVVMDYKSSKEGHKYHVKQVNNYRYGVRSITQRDVKAYIVYLVESGIELYELP